MPKYEIAVTQSITTTVEVEAEDKDDALAQVDRRDFPLPPRDEWTGQKDWEYAVVSIDGEPQPYDEDLD